MATVLKVTRLSNPHGGVRPRRAVRRRGLTPLQKLYFGSKRQRISARRDNPARRRRALPRGAARPRRASIPAARRRVRRAFNPALVATLGAMNPHKRSNNVARTRKRSATSARRVNRRRATSRASNPFRRRRRIINRRRRNATRIVVVAPRRRRHANPRRAYRRVRRYNRRHNRRRNPMQTIAGQNIFSKGGAILIGGGLVGVAAAKFIPTLIPSSIQSTLGGSTIMKVVVTGASAVAAGWLASKVSQAFGEGVLFGGLMQTGSVALNAFLPGFQIAGIPIGLSGFGELLPGSFAIPQNPIRAAIAPPAPPAGSAAGPRLTVSGLSRAYGTAF